MLLTSGVTWADVTMVNSAKEFLAALEGGEKHIQLSTNIALSRQRSTLSATEETINKDYTPIVIPEGTTITGGTAETKYTLSLRFPMQIAGNVTLENITLNFTNSTDYQRTIFMAGHALTLKTISTAGGTYGFNIYAGGFVFDNGSPKEGATAILTLDAPNAGSTGSPDPLIDTIWLASAEEKTFKSYAGVSAMTLSQKTYVRQVYAQGAAITIDGSGLQAATTQYETNKETTLSLTAGVLQRLSQGVFKVVNVPNGATLALDELTADSVISIAQYNGGGTLLRNESGVVKMEAYTAITILRFTATTEEGLMLVESAQPADANNAFTLHALNEAADYTLQYIDGGYALIPNDALFFDPREGYVRCIPEAGGEVLFNAMTGELTASPNDGYVFAGWYTTQDVASLEPTAMFTLEEDLIITAHFLPKQLKATLDTAAVTQKVGALALSEPLLCVNDEQIEVGVKLRRADALPTEDVQWKDVDTIIDNSATFDISTSTLKVSLPAKEKGFFKFVIEK